MKRFLWLIPVIVLCLWMTRKTYGYWYFSQDLSNPNWSSWHVVIGPLSSTWYSPGGYGGLTGNGYMTGSGLTQGEVKLTVRQAAGSSSGAYEIYTDFTGTSYLQFRLTCGTSASTLILYDNYYVPDYYAWGQDQLVYTSAPACHDNMILRAVQEFDYSGAPIERFYVDNTLVAYYVWNPVYQYHQWYR